MLQERESGVWLFGLHSFFFTGGTGRYRADECTAVPEGKTKHNSTEAMSEAPETMETDSAASVPVSASTDPDETADVAVESPRTCEKEADLRVRVLRV